MPIKIVTDDDELEDGRTVRVPLVVMDADLSHHRPGFRVSDEASKSSSLADLDAARDAARSARDAWIKQTTDAWRMDAKRKKPPPDDDDDDGAAKKGSRRLSPDRSGDTADARQAARDAYDAMCSRLTNAWRTPVRDAPEPDSGTPPEELMRRHTFDPDADVQARRDRAHADYVTRTTNAWRNPPGVTPQQTAIVGAGPKSMVVEPARGRTDPDRAGEVERVRANTLGSK